MHEAARSVCQPLPADDWMATEAQRKLHKKQEVRAGVKTHESQEKQMRQTRQRSWIAPLESDFALHSKHQQKHEHF